MSPAGAIPTAGIVLAGGRSERMGTPKAWVGWGGSTLLGRSVAALATVTDRVVVVRSAGQELPPLPHGVAIVDDEHPDRGPLEGVTSGLDTLDPGAVAFVCAVDMPLLDGRFAAAVLASLPRDADAAVPRLDGRPQPLAAAYRAGVAETGRALLRSGRRSMGGLLDAIEVRWLDDVPGARAALRNVNTPVELEAARQAMGEKGTTDPAAPSSPSPTQARAVAPASEVTA